MKPSGPRSASASAAAPKTIVQSHYARNPKSSSESAAAAVAMISVRSDGARDRQHHASDDAPELDRDERVRQGERGDEGPTGDDDQEGHAQVPPEEPRVEPAEDAKLLWDGVDAPAAGDPIRRVHPARA